MQKLVETELKKKKIELYENKYVKKYKKPIGDFMKNGYIKINEYKNRLMKKKENKENKENKGNEIE